MTRKRRQRPPDFYRNQTKATARIRRNVEIENTIQSREYRRSKLPRSNSKSGIGQLAIEAEDGYEGQEVFIDIFSFNLYLPDPRKNCGDSAEKAKITKGEAKNRGGG
jgi:hypothetical protein